MPSGLCFDLVDPSAIIPSTISTTAIRYDNRLTRYPKTGVGFQIRLQTRFQFSHRTNTQGFDIEGLDKLTKHLTDSSKSNPQDPAKDLQQQSADAIDSQLEELISQIESSGMMDQMDKALDHNVIQEAKTKLTEALNQVANITNEEQREKVKSILDVQVKLVDYLAGISPLVGEFKSALNSIKK